MLTCSVIATEQKPKRIIGSKTALILSLALSRTLSAECLEHVAQITPNRKPNPSQGVGADFSEPIFAVRAFYSSFLSMVYVCTADRLRGLADVLTCDR